MKERNWAAAREMLDELMEKTPAAAGVTYEKRSGGVPGWCVVRKTLSPKQPFSTSMRRLCSGFGAFFPNFVGQVAVRAKLAAFVQSTVSRRASVSRSDKRSTAAYRA